jgi:tRNA threonylcarbamoyladenosine biosynthesis protein TsaE
MKIKSRSVKETIGIGKRLARHLRIGDIVALSGIFGAGKTYFTKGIAQGLGIKKSQQVNSPSFVLCNVYNCKKLKIYHFDAHRLPKAEELLELGLTDCFYDGVCVLEWAEKVSGLAGQSNVIPISFKVKSANERILTLLPNKRLKKL